jgi:hypothetical protein
MAPKQQHKSAIPPWSGGQIGHNGFDGNGGRGEELAQKQQFEKKMVKTSVGNSSNSKGGWHLGARGKWMWKLG